MAPNLVSYKQQRNLQWREDDEGLLVLVSGSNDPRAIAAAVTGSVREGKRVRLRAIGASAVNQAIKGAAISRAQVAESNELTLLLSPWFQELWDEKAEQRTTSMVLTVVIRPR